MAQIDRALTLLRQEAPLTEEMRSFVAASLEDEAESAREVREAQRDHQLYMARYPFGFRDCFVTRHHYVVCV